MRPDQASKVARLQTLRGHAFDRAYLGDQIAGHRELLALNSNEIQTGADTRNRTVATLAVPAIETHLDMLRRLSGGGEVG